MTPTRETAIQMALKAGFNSSPMYPASVIVQHCNGSFVDVTSRVEALVAAAYALGATQAQQTTVEEPELPEAVAWRWMYQDQPDSERCFNAPLPNLAVLAVAESAEFRRTVQAFYTATQMHAHFQAGVRAGAAGSQDAKRYRAIRDGLEVEPDNSRIVVSLIDDFGGETLRGEQADAAIDKAMQGDKQ